MNIEEINNLMTISLESYKDLKEYWDFQRKIEYNREILKEQVEKRMSGMVYGETGQLSDEVLYDFMWSKIREDDMDEPPVGWVPKNQNYRLWNEEYPPKKQLPKPKGRPVVLKAKVNERSK